MEIKEICNLIDERKEELFDLLSRMIRINSENFSSHGNEEPMARFLEALCRELELETDLYSPLDIEGFTQHPDYMPGRGLENRYNLTAIWKGLEDTNQLLLMGHTDTVEIGDPANWDFDPLGGLIRDGKILGRGACDDKYALAAVIFLIRVLKDAGFVPKKNLVFSAYSDEEHGGSHGALAAVLRHPCESIVNLDGRFDPIWHCGSGGQEAIYTYHVKDTVDSAKRAGLAIPVVLEVLDSFAQARQQELEANPFYAGTPIPGTSMRYMGIRAGSGGMDLGVGQVYFVYYTDKTKEQIEAEFEALDRVLKERLAPLGIIGDGFAPKTRFFHYVYCQPDSEDILLMQAAAQEAIGRAPQVRGSCLSDLSVISKYGSDRAFAIGCGRDFSEPGGAHQPNEYIECDAFVDFTKTVGAYILKKLG